MSHFRLISRNGQGIALLPKLAAEGHKVDFWVSSLLAKEIYQGIIEQVNDWSEGLSEDTVLLFDKSGSGSVAEKLKESGIRTYGTGKLNDVLEYDNEFAMRIAKIHGLLVPEFNKFDTKEDAIEFLSTTENQWNFMGCDFYNNDELIKVLNHYQPVNFMLTERIEGKKIQIEAWYLNGELIPGSINSSVIEENTDALVAWYWPPKKPNKQKRKEYTEATLYRQTLKKLEPFLKKSRFSGPLTARCIISLEDGLPYIIGFKSGLQFPKLYALLEGLNKGQTIGELLETLAAGRMIEFKPCCNEYLSANAVTINPCYANHLILGIEDIEHVWPIDIKSKDEKLLTAGTGGAVLYVTAKNKEIAQLGKDICKLAATIKLPDKQDVNRDFFFSSEKTIRFLRKWRYF